MRNDLIEARTTYSEDPLEGVTSRGGGCMVELGKDFKKTLLDLLGSLEMHTSNSKPQDSIPHILFRHCSKTEVHRG